MPATMASQLRNREPTYKGIKTQSIDIRKGNHGRVYVTHGKVTIQTDATLLG